MLSTVAFVLHSDSDLILIVGIISHSKLLPPPHRSVAMAFVYKRIDLSVMSIYPSEVVVVVFFLFRSLFNFPGLMLIEINW